MPKDRPNLRHGLNLVRIPKPNDYCFCGSSKKYRNCCLTMIVTNTGGGSNMLIRKIGGIDIYRPRTESEHNFRNMSEKHLREKFKAGTYTDFKTIDAIIKHQVAFFGDKFDSLIPLLASRSFMDFLMFQYDQTGELDELEKSGKLHGDALINWTTIGPTYRRTLKYIAERTTMLASTIDPTNNGDLNIDLLDLAFICAEELIEFCILSDQARLYKDSTQITIHPPGKEFVLDHSISNSEIDSSFRERIRYHRRMVKEVYEIQQPFDFNLHARHLDEPLQSHLGANYNEAINMLQNLYEGAKPNSEKNNFPTVFVNKQEVINKLAKAFNKSDETVKKVLAGFSLTREDMTKEGRDYWNPQFHYRAYRRGMLSMPHESGQHLAWGKRLYSECLMIMLTDVAFGHFPVEWRSDHINKGLGDIGRESSKWFEQRVQNNLAQIGINGLASRTAIGIGNTAIKITPGELDFIGWCPVNNSLVLLECKMLQSGTEPRMWKNHIDAFLTDKEDEKSFVSKLKRKALWVFENVSVVCKALSSEGIEIKTLPENIYSAFITYTPNAASYFVNDFPCVSLPEFLSDYKSNSTWPYDRGIQKCQQLYK